VVIRRSDSTSGELRTYTSLLATMTRAHVVPSHAAYWRRVGCTFDADANRRGM